MKYFDYLAFFKADTWPKYEERIKALLEKEDKLENRPDTDLYFDSAYYTVLAEGMELDRQRAEAIVQGKVNDLSRPESIFLGYYELIQTIDDAYEYMAIRPNIILQLHRDMYSYVNKSLGGNYRNACIYVNEEMPDGSLVPYFEPLPAHETKVNLDNLCDHFNLYELSREQELAKSLLFLLDFYLIHPFNFGNGEALKFMVRLILKKAGIHSIDYFSIEKALYQDQKNFMQAIKESALGHEKGLNDYRPFVNYMLDLLEK